MIEVTATSVDRKLIQPRFIFLVLSDMEQYVCVCQRSAKALLRECAGVRACMCVRGKMREMCTKCKSAGEVILR